MAIVLCGEKRKHLEIPEGWRKLDPNEEVLKDDKAANIRAICWELVNEDEIGFTAEIAGDHIIRKVKI